MLIRVLILVVGLLIVSPGPNRFLWGVPPAMGNEQREFFCPERPNQPYEIVTCYEEHPRGSGKYRIKAGFPKKTEKSFTDGEDVSGDGVKDLRGQSAEDLAGNKVECWCIQGSATESQQFYYCFIPVGTTDRHWFGGCFYPNGQNMTRPIGPSETQGANAGRTKKYDCVTQDNIDWGGPRDRPPTGTNDKHYKYYNSGPNKGKYVLTRTTGQWKKVGAVGGVDQYQYETQTRQEGAPTTPPPRPKDIVTQGIPPDNPGFDAPSVVLLASGADLPRWRYALLVGPAVRLEAVDPVTGDSIAAKAEGSITAGDVLVIGGRGIGGPFVEGRAALPAYGGWIVSDFDSNHVTFVATASVEDTAQIAPIGTLGFTSFMAPGTVNWGYSGTEVGNASTALGPGIFTADVPVQSAGLTLEVAQPNPVAFARGPVVLTFALPTAGQAELSVYDAQSRRVRSLLSAQLESGIHQVRWDGMSAGGARARSGTYFAQLRFGDRVLTTRIVVAGE